MQKVTVRKGTLQDLIEVHELKHKVWLSTYVNLSEGITEEVINTKKIFRAPQIDIDRIKERMSRHPIFVAVLDKKVIGFVHPNIDEEGLNRVGRLYVDSDYQGLGVGSMLIRKVFEYFPQQDIYLICVDFNLKARKFYEKWGFKEIEEREKVFIRLPMEKGMYAIWMRYVYSTV